MKALLLLCWAIATAPLGEAFMTPQLSVPVSRFGTPSKLPMSVVSSVEEQFPDENPQLQQQTGGLFARNSITQQTIDTAVNVGVLGGGVLFVLSYLCLLNSHMWHGWTAEEILTRIPIDAWFQYSGTLAENPITTKACTSATVYTIGDIIAQRTAGTAVGELDRNRILRSLTAGLIAHGPLSHFWYIVCDGFFDSVLMWTAWWVFLPKVIVDQLLWGPFWNNTYIVMLGVMKGEGLETIWKDIQRTTVPLIVSGLKLWPAAHLITYGLVPVENRLLWVDLVEILWVTILATQASGSNKVVVEEKTPSA